MYNITLALFLVWDQLGLSNCVCISHLWITETVIANESISWADVTWSVEILALGDIVDYSSDSKENRQIAIPSCVSLQLIQCNLAHREFVWLNICLTPILPPRLPGQQRKRSNEDNRSNYPLILLTCEQEVTFKQPSMANSENPTCYSICKLQSVDKFHNALLWNPWLWILASIISTCSQSSTAWSFILCGDSAQMHKNGAEELNTPGIGVQKKRKQPQVLD